ncbi:hypothetical protein EDD86DRAFT_218152 [Gorgonomyces haynaldii]|nr:hypothetical protein EDD86DRAFT_218152 [Gorgonomyces haynaldii]
MTEAVLAVGAVVVRLLVRLVEPVRVERLLEEDELVERDVVDELGTVDAEALLVEDELGRVDAEVKGLTGVEMLEEERIKVLLETMNVLDRVENTVIGTLERLKTLLGRVSSVKRDVVPTAVVENDRMVEGSVVVKRLVSDSSVDLGITTARSLSPETSRYSTNMTQEMAAQYLSRRGCEKLSDLLSFVSGR